MNLPLQRPTVRDPSRTIRGRSPASPSMALEGPRFTPETWDSIFCLSRTPTGTVERASVTFDWSRLERQLAYAGVVNGAIVLIPEDQLLNAGVRGRSS